MKMSHGVKAYRIVAMIKDGVHDHWCCFFDVNTKTIYIEEVHMRHSGPWSYNDCHQVMDNTTWNVLVEFLQSPDVQVLQTVEHRYEIDQEHKKKTGESKLHLSNSLWNLPKEVLGVDEKGSSIISSGLSPKQIAQLTKSPSAWTDGEMPASGKLHL